MPVILLDYTRDVLLSIMQLEFRLSTVAALACATDVFMYLVTYDCISIAPAGAAASRAMLASASARMARPR